MDKLNISRHIFNNTSSTILPVLQKVKDIYKNWILIHRHLPRTERLSIGLRVDVLLLDLLELLRKATYSPIHLKIGILEECLNKNDSLNFFIQIMWENKLISNNQFALLGERIENTGKIINGWKKGLLRKTPTDSAGERKE